MDIAEKILIDVEKTNGLCGYWIRSEDGTQIETISSVKMITAVDEEEHKNRIYKLLEDNCDLFFCTTVKLKDFEFYPVPMLSIFAGDSDGRYFGTIGGVGELGGDDCYPVGYIDRKGKHGKIAGSFKEFMELVVFYPYWKDTLNYEEIVLDYDIDEISKKQKNESATQYLAKQIESQKHLIFRKIYNQLNFFYQISRAPRIL